MTPQQLLDRLDLPYTEKSNRLEMLCVFHDDRNPSAGFYHDTERFYCYSCDLSLDVVGFYARYKEVTREEAERAVGEGKARRQVDKLALGRAKTTLERKLGQLESEGVELDVYARAAENVDNLLSKFTKGTITEEELREAVSTAVQKDWKTYDWKNLIPNYTKEDEVDLE